MKFLFGLLLMVSSVAQAYDDMGRYVGYVIAAKKTIVGYQNSDGKREDSFEGCDFGRAIIFDDGTYLTCSGYGYQYAYRPEAILLVRNGSWKMIVNSSAYDMRN
jgi:hypothetical protein